MWQTEMIRLAVRVSAGVIYGEVRARSGVCECVCARGRTVHRGPSLPPLSNHGVDLWPPQGGCESPVVR